MTKQVSFDIMRKPMTERYIQTLLAYSASRSPRHIALTQSMWKPCLQATVFRSIRSLSFPRDLIAAPIATAETSLDGDNITFTFADASGNVLYTDYEVVPDNGIVASTGNMQNITSTEAVMTYSALKTLDSYTYSGTIVTNGKNFRYSEEYDLSDYSEIGKANLLYSKGVISEDEKYSFYADYLEDDSAEHVECGTHIINELNDYYESNDMSQIYSLEAYPSHDKSIAISVGLEIIYVNYVESEFTGYTNELNAFVDLVEDVSTYYCITNGFLAPEGPGGATLKIFITSEGLMNGDSAGTFDKGNGASEIRIRESLVKSGDATRTIAHEFMHAIMNKYCIDDAPKWFDESFASMASLVYIYDNCHTELNSGEGFNWFRQAIAAYVNNSNLSIFDEDTEIGFFNYGSLLFPLCIYEKHGGWTTIKYIFEEYNNCYSYWDAFEGSYNWARFNYESIFSEMSIANAIPKDSNLGYTTPTGLTDRDVIWPSAPRTEKDLTSTHYGYISPMSNQYYKYSAIGNAGNLYITVESYDPLTFYILQEQITQYVITDDSGVYRATFESDNFGLSSANDTILVVVVNTLTSGDNSWFDITSTCG